MKRFLTLLLLIPILIGCSSENNLEARAIALRSKLQQSSGCTFDVIVTADYSNQFHTFSLNCAVDSAGSMTFTVTAPETIQGICGTVSSQGGKLSFAETVLSFPLLADGQLSPVSAPWIFYKTLAGGYLKNYTLEGEYLRLSLDDTYESDALQLDIWLGAGDLPVQADICYDNRRILTLQIENFRTV